MDRTAHWDRVYEERHATELSWFRPHLETSLALIRASNLDEGGRIIDVGGGSSTLVDDLLADGFRAVTVLDLSGTAIRQSCTRLGAKGLGVTWIEEDVTQVELPEETYDLWHDRATFHFLTEEDDRQRYVGAVRRALRPGGQVILGTFAAEGPARCSGFPVVRYSAQALVREFGAGFQLLEERRETHQTPTGADQDFTYVRLRCGRAAGPPLSSRPMGDARTAARWASGGATRSRWRSPRGFAPESGWSSRPQPASTRSTT